MPQFPSRCVIRKQCTWRSVAALAPRRWYPPPSLPCVRRNDACVRAFSLLCIALLMGRYDGEERLRSRDTTAGLCQSLEWLCDRNRCRGRHLSRRLLVFRLFL